MSIDEKLDVPAAVDSGFNVADSEAINKNKTNSPGPAKFKVELNFTCFMLGPVPN